MGQINSTVSILYFELFAMFVCGLVLYSCIVPAYTRVHYVLYSLGASNRVCGLFVYWYTL